MSLLDALMGDKGLVVKFKADLTDLQTGMVQAKTDLTKWRDETNASSRDMMRWGAAIGATAAPVIAVGAAAYATIEKFGGMAQEIKDLSYTTGLSTQKIQELQYAATLSGTEFSSVTMGIDQFTLAVSKAGDASSDAGKAFATLGVTTSGRTTDEILEDTFAALVNTKNESDRNALAVTLLGRSWKELIPYMEAYIKNAKEIKANPYLTDEELTANAEAKEQIDALGKRWEIAEGKMISYFTGLFTNMDKAAVEAARKDPSGFYSSAILKDQPTASAENSLLNPNYIGTTAGTIEVSGSDLSHFTTQFVDKYKGMTDAEMELVDATTALTDAQKAQENALTQADYDKASEDVQKYTNKIADLKTELASGLTTAQNDYNNALEKMQEINKDFSRELSITDIGDVAKVRDLTIRHNWAIEDQQNAIKTTSAMISAEKVKYGDTIIQIDGKEVARATGTSASIGTANVRSLTQSGAG